MAVNAPPAQSIGDITQFNVETRVPGAGLPGAGQMPVRATILSDVWGHAIGHCSLNPTAMFAARGTLQIAAISKQEIVVQWLASAKAPAIDCRAAPALLAVSEPDYQNMVNWAATPNRRALYK